MPPEAVLRHFDLSLQVPTDREMDMKALAAKRDIRKIRAERMEKSIINTVRRYFQSDSARPGKRLEYAIMDAMRSYFEGPGREEV